MRRWSKRIFASFIVILTLAGITGATYQAIASRRELAANPPPGQLVDIGGYRLHIWCMGVGSPSVILDTGLGGSFLGWSFVQPEVAKFTRVCSYDRAGMGFSDLGPMPRTSGRIAAELHKLLDRAGIEERVVLVGASVAGYDTRIFASEYQDRTAGLLLVDASHEDQGARYAAAGVPEDRIWYARAVPVLAFLGVMRAAGNPLQIPRTLPESLRRYGHVGLRTDAYRTVADEYLNLSQSTAEVKATRRKLGIPLVVLTAGQSDNSAQGRAAWQEMQQDQVSLSELGCQIIAEHAHHGIAIQMPDVVVQAIRLVVDTARNGGGRPKCSDASSDDRR